MHILLRENIEAYLAGTLPPAEQQAVEGHLAGCAECRDELEALWRTAEMLRSLRPRQGLEWEPAPGFYARVLDRIDQEREIPFWAMLLDPAFGRRLVFACLMVLAVLGAWVAASERPDFPALHRPESILACNGPNCAVLPPVKPAVRLGPNLEHNRGVVLASLVTEGD